MSNNKDYKDLNKLVSSLSNNLKALEEGTLSVYDLELLLDNARSVHERITVLHYLAIEREVKGADFTENTVPQQNKGIRFDFEKKEPEIHPNQTNLIDAIETQHHVEAVKKSIGEQKPLFESNDSSVSATENFSQKETSVSIQNKKENKQPLPPTLNDKFADRAEPTLVDKLSQQPIKDLSKAIGLNQKFLFMNDLFDGENDEYKNAINTINSFSTYMEADEYINNVLKVKYKWDFSGSSAQDFVNLVKRRFL